MKVVLENLTKKYPNRNKKEGGEVVAVDGFNFEIPDGKLIGLLGPSGCGKSTTLNLISGLEAPTEGKIYFGGDDVTDLPPENRGVGLVFQNYALYPHLTVRKNIRFPLENLKKGEKMTNEEMDAKALEAAKLVQIDEYMERKPSELSGGQQQRVAVARALANSPEIILADEPTANLDQKTGQEIIELFQQLQHDLGVTIISATHDTKMLKASNRILWIEDGRIVKAARPEELDFHSDEFGH